MKFFNDLLGEAGLASKKLETTLGFLLLSLVSFFGILLLTHITGFAIAISVLAVLFGFEALRLRAKSRQEKMQKAWPSLFDSMAQSVASGMRSEEQFEYLAQSGPIELRKIFQAAVNEIAIGKNFFEVTNKLQGEFSNRHGDLFCQILELGEHIGLSGQRENWKNLARRTRAEQGALGLILAKQDWVIGSAKIALLSPWLIAGLLMQLPQNKDAFASQAGSAILIVGLSLSVFAYFLVNYLGRISNQPRIFDAPA